MRNFNKLFALAVTVCFSASVYAQKIIGYIPQYRTTAQMDAAIEWDKMTDYYYFGSLPTTSGTITLEQPTRFDHVKQKAATYNKNLWISCGGWGKSSAFITVANSASLSQKFADEALALCQAHNLTGIDIDWEFPAYGQETAFRNFFKTLYETLNPAGYKVSAAAGGEATHADKWTGDIFDYIDDLNIMSYDDPNLTDGNHASLQFMKNSMDLYNAQGCPFSKMLGGVAFYSRCAGVLMYSNISDNQSGAAAKQAAYENSITGGYCYNGKTEIGEKIDYVMGKGGIGILIWEVTQDKLGTYSLLTACDDAMDKHKCSAPTPDLGSDVSICGLSSVTLDGGVSPQSGVTFTWKNSSGTLVNQSSSASTYNASSAGTYTLEVWQGGCNRSDEIEVTGVLNTPDLGGPYELCDPVSVTLDAGVSGVGRTIEWQLNNTTISGETGSTLVAKKGGTYKVIVSATGCSSVNASATVTSEVPYADNDTVCSAGDQANLVASETVKWYASETAPTELATSQTYTPTVNSNTTFWMGGAGAAQTQYTTLKSAYAGGWGASTSNYGTKIEVLADLTIDAITVKPVGSGTLKMNLKASDGTTIVKTKSFSVSSGEQEVQLDWTGVAPGTYFIDAEGSSMQLTIDGTQAPSDFTVAGVLTSEQHCYEKWGGAYSASTNWGFFINLKITAGSQCARVPVDVVIDAANPSCLTVGSEETSFKNTNIFPNPSNKQFTIENAKGNLSVFDIKGSLIESQILNDTRAVFGENLKPGVYFVQLNNNGTIGNFKVIKK